MAKIITENFKVETTNELFNSFVNTNATVGSNFATSLATYNTTGSLSLSSTQQTTIKGFVDTQLASLKPESDYYIMGSSIDKANNISNTQHEKRDFQRRVIFGNKITDDDVRYMFKSTTWTSGTIYDDFDDTQDVSLLNMFVTITNSEGNHYIFKCLENNNGGPSTVAPSINVGVAGSVDPNTYESVSSSDSYVWKYMFSVTNSDAQIYSTSDSLPLPYPAYGDSLVKSAAKESISQVLITNTPNSLFSKCVFGPGLVTDTDPTGTLTSSTVTLDAVTGDTLTDPIAKNIRIKISPKSGAFLDTASNAYTNLYLWRNDGEVYDIITSTVSSATGDIIDVTINTTHTKTSFTDGARTYMLVPKIEVSRSVSTGTPCIAYGVIDRFGTLVKVSFIDKGSKYKFATAELKLPPGVSAAAGFSSLTPTVLRAVVSPTGGHGSNPVNEMSMSRLAVITNFSGEDLPIPDSNFYTKVALLKNPIFVDGTKPTQFDNRAVITVAGDKTSLAIVGHYVTQEVSLSGGNGTESETVVSRIHSAVYDGSSNTKIYLVDVSGNFQNIYQTGNVFVRANPTSVTASSPISINNASNDVVYGNYSPYTGEILHFVDFDPIQRRQDRKEKIKFIFDF